MKGLAIIVGLGVLVGGGIALAMAASKDTVTLKRGAAYRWKDARGFGLEETKAQYESLGFASVVVGLDPGGFYVVQAIWGGMNNTPWDIPEGLSTPEYLGFIGSAANTRASGVGSIQTFIPGLHVRE